MRKKLSINSIRRRLFKTPEIINYDSIWKTILSRDMDGFPTALGAFTSWDNTPRRGEQGTVFFKSTPDKFYQYLLRLFNKCLSDNYSEYIFINAWNEWAEGAHLEPDEKNGFGYLESLKKVMMKSRCYK